MATATSVALVLLLLAAVSSSLPAADADAGFISQTCNKTKNATLCVALVSLWPGSARASTERDLAGIGLLIAADAASHRAEVISDLANSSQGMPEWGALVVCTRAYLDADKDVERSAPARASTAGTTPARRSSSRAPRAPLMVARRRSIHVRRHAEFSAGHPRTHAWSWDQASFFLCFSTRSSVSHSFSALSSLPILSFGRLPPLNYPHPSR